MAHDETVSVTGMEARLAANRREIRAAQRLRYQVFFEERSLRSGPITRFLRRDFDRWDRVCDHLLLTGPGGEVIGTTRLLRQEAARNSGLGFYSEGEFDIAALLNRHEGLRFMELGRSCVLRPYRGRRSIELLWGASWTYALAHQIDVMFGCASFPTDDPAEIAESLSWLRRFAAPEPQWNVSAAPGLGISLPRPRPDQRSAFATLPPLLKGYLRLGAWVASEAVIDRRFRTTDVLIILPLSRLNPRYVRYFADRLAQA